MIVVDPSPAHAFLSGWADTAPAPAAVIVATAHFEAPGPTLTSTTAPDTIHDFGGFPEALYRLRYRAPGAPALAEQAAALLAQAGFAPRLDPRRGLDHGTWTPLMLMLPEATTPVVQLSVDPSRDAAWHYRVGQALSPLRDENVLILGSGSLTHNLQDFFRGRPRTADEAPEAYVAAFAAWAQAALEAGDVASVLNWTSAAPHALRNHPTPEHLLPLFVALGAGGGARATRVHGSFSYGVLAMDAYAFA
jgi:4,5-DOPA dioxygenase extradiol